MPIEPMSFPLLTFEQSNPALMRMKYDLGNLLGGMQGLSQVRNLQNEAALKQQQSNWYGKDVASQIAQRMAESAKLNKETSWVDRLNQAQIDAQEALAKYRDMGGPNLGAGGKEQILYQNLVSRDNPDLDRQEAYEAANVLASGGDTLSNGKKLNPLSPAAQYSLDRIQKGSTTAQGLNQQRAASVLNNIFDQADEHISGAVKFAGLGGRFNKNLDAARASVGENDPDYKDYFIFSKVIVPQLTNQMLITEGGRVTDRQKAIMLDLANPDAWASNPKLQMEKYKSIRDTFKNVDKTVATGPAALRNQLINGINEAPKIKGAQSSEKARGADTNWEFVNGRLVQVQ